MSYNFSVSTLQQFVLQEKNQHFDAIKYLFSSLSDEGKEAIFYDFGFCFEKQGKFYSLYSLQFGGVPRFYSRSTKLIDLFYTAINQNWNFKI